MELKKCSIKIIINQQISKYDYYMTCIGSSTIFLIWKTQVWMFGTTLNMSHKVSWTIASYSGEVEGTDQISRIWDILDNFPLMRSSYNWFSILGTIRWPHSEWASSNIFWPCLIQRVCNSFAKYCGGLKKKWPQCSLSWQVMSNY